MPQIRTFAQAHQRLHAFYDPHQVSFTLERIRQLMEYLGNPQNSLKVVHIAGTSGKTSTAYYAAALLEQSGASVGLTVSPHVDEVNERVQLNHTPLPEAVFCRELEEFLELIGPSDVQPSYFEVLVAFAYWEFVRQAVDYAVIEVGLGGRFDATNVVSRADKVCIITDIGLDHTEILGDTLDKIATEKAQIIQPGNHVFMHRQSLEVQDVIKEQCLLQDAPLTVLRDATAPIGLPPFQQRNFSLAARAVEYVLERDGRRPLTQQQLEKAAMIYIPARMEQLKLKGKTVVIDGSHNGQKLAALAAGITSRYPGQPVAALMAFVGGNDERWQRGIAEILPLIDELVLTSFSAEQDMPKKSVDPERVAEYCKGLGYTKVQVIPDPKLALAQLQKCPQPILLVAGSFYLLNHIRPLIMKK